jgi:hypothetical protein
MVNIETWFNKSPTVTGRATRIACRLETRGETSFLSELVTLGTIYLPPRNRL